MRSAVVLMGASLLLAASAASPATDTLTIRGPEQSLRVYGTRGGPAAVVASGDVPQASYRTANVAFVFAVEAGSCGPGSAPERIRLTL